MISQRQPRNLSHHQKLPKLPATWQSSSMRCPHPASSSIPTGPKRTSQHSGMHQVLFSAERLILGFQVTASCLVPAVCLGASQVPSLFPDLKVMGEENRRVEPFPADHKHLPALNLDFTRSQAGQGSSVCFCKDTD